MSILNFKKTWQTFIAKKQKGLCSIRSLLRSFRMTL